MDSFNVQTDQRDQMVEITDRVRRVVEHSGVQSGAAIVYVPHTTAGVTINENADPDVLIDLETYLSDLVPDGDHRYIHVAEGPDDMAAHVRSALTLTSLSVPVIDGQLDLGTWQAVYLWEHRHAPHRRRLTVTIQGEG